VEGFQLGVGGGLVVGREVLVRARSGIIVAIWSGSLSARSGRSKQGTVGSYQADPGGF
jgi:hypothetical protein